MNLAEKLRNMANDYNRDNQSEMVKMVIDKATEAARHGEYSIVIDGVLDERDSYYLASRGLILTYTKSREGEHKTGVAWNE